jgi:Kef-type K+ transport system membrane component KefB
MNTIEKTTSNMAMGFLAPIFFAGIGLEFNISSISNMGLLISVIVVSYLSKVIGGFLGGTFAGLSKRTSWTLGIGLNARGIMELVIANIAFKNNLINTEVFSILVLMGILTTLTTPLMLKKAFGKN